MSSFKLKIEDVKYDDSTRQRRLLEGIEELQESIRRVGVINAIVVDEENNLIAGRRRLEACKRLGYPDILARRISDLSTADKRLLELDENLRRVDLPWTDSALALLELHTLKSESDAGWNQERTAEYCGLSAGHIAKSLLVARAISKGSDEKIKICKNVDQAADYLRRKRDLILQTALSKGFSDAPAPEDYENEERRSPGSEPSEEPRGALPDPLAGSIVHLQTEASGKYRIREGDFLKFIDTVEYPQWNLIHCDFPYGINFDKSAQAGSAQHESQYEDSEELFWNLTYALLKNQDRLILSSAHMIFWFSMKYYEDLVAALTAYQWFVVPHPLIWYKSDGAGIVSDYRRRPKHIYETALFCSRGDRMISQLRNDVFASGIAKNQEGHLSAKPQEMLEHFLSMVCGPESDLLDPTCGSGTSIRAAAALGANSALGLEIDSGNAQNARTRLRTQLLQVPL